MPTTNAVLFGRPQPSTAENTRDMVWAVKSRRFIVADEARGLVGGIGFFDSNGDLQGRPAPKVYVYELFKIRSGRIRSIQAWVRTWDPDTPE